MMMYLSPFSRTFFSKMLFNDFRIFPLFRCEISFRLNVFRILVYFLELFSIEKRFLRFFFAPTFGNPLYVFGDSDMVSEIGGQYHVLDEVQNILIILKHRKQSGIRAEISERLRLVANFRLVAQKWLYRRADYASYADFCRQLNLIARYEFNILH